MKSSTHMFYVFANSKFCDTDAVRNIALYEDWLN